MTTAKHDGKPIVKNTIAIRNAGDGLSEGLAIDPVDLHIGEKRYVVLETIVSGDEFKGLDKKTTDLLQRQFVLTAGVGILVDEDLVLEQIEEMKRRLDTAREERRLEEERAKGVNRLPDKTDEELHEEHVEGGHDAAPITGCVDCQRILDEAGEHDTVAKALPTKKAAARKAATRARSGRKRA